ncbi:hypothetical protein CMU89_15070 [Elizabethkingia anophelis]|nr:hypothetical protein [Elizabethkingia anophelis]MDV3543964.1 hypothetical protein [Elizabethkingia anophelis]PKR31410.1 hypothetical protein CWH99_11615 [Elizabethkingia anophelis]PKR34645.1 hypothetical protein CWI00_08085 [Elizabethkingia anophelis]PRQ81767.1 hypothetical protein CMT60_01370 [Elizabethkingia anophelis]
MPLWVFLVLRFFLGVFPEDKKSSLCQIYTAILDIIFSIASLHHYFRDLLSLNNKSWHPVSYKASILYDYDDQTDKKAIAFLFFTKNN